MIALSQPEQRCAEQRRLLQIEDPLCLRSRFLADLFFLLCFWRVAEIDRAQSKFHTGGDSLERLAILNDKAGP